MSYKIAQTNYAARALEEGIDLAFEAYRLKKMKDRMAGSAVNKELIQNDPLLSKVIEPKQKAVTAKELVNTFIGESSK